MKKILALLMAAVMVFALCACGSSSAPAPAASAAPEASEAPEAAEEAAPAEESAEPAEEAAEPAEEAPAAEEAAEEAPAGAKEVLIMGTSADYPPFEYQYPNDAGEIVYAGVDVAVGQYIADFTGKELKIENMGFDYLLASLQKGDFDMVIAAMEISEERLNSADFSDPYYTDAPAKILVRAADADLYTSYDSFEGKSVGAQTATTKEGIVNDMLTGANLVSLQVVTDLVNQLVNNKIDAIVLDGGVAEEYAESNPDLVIADIEFETAEPYRVAVAKGDPKGLLPGINEAIADMLSQDKIPEFYAAAKSHESEAIMEE